MRVPLTCYNAAQALNLIIAYGSDLISVVEISQGEVCSHRVCAKICSTNLKKKNTEITILIKELSGPEMVGDEKPLFIKMND